MTKETEFRSDLWKKFTHYRKKAARLIIKNKCLVGKSKREINDLFGQEDNLYDLDEWAYLVNKNILGGKTFLLVHFNGEKVERESLYTVYQVGNNAVLSI